MELPKFDSVKAGIIRQALALSKNNGIEREFYSKNTTKVQV